MDKSEVIKILRNEELCVKTADACERDCGKCPLVMDSGKIIEAYDTAIEMLSEPERKTANWIDGYKRQKCSLCAYRGVKSWNFCPNCGARMAQEGLKGEDQ